MKSICWYYSKEYNYDIFAW